MVPALVVLPQGTSINGTAFITDVGSRQFDCKSRFNFRPEEKTFSMQRFAVKSTLIRFGDLSKIPASMIQMKLLPAKLKTLESVPAYADKNPIQRLIHSDATQKRSNIQYSFSDSGFYF